MNLSKKLSSTIFIPHALAKRILEELLVGLLVIKCVVNRFDTVEQYQSDQQIKHYCMDIVHLDVGWLE